MKQGIIFSLLILMIAHFGFGQYTTVQYDLEKNYFNEGQALPAEKPLMFTGVIPRVTDIIEISIFPSKANQEKDRLYLASWKDFDNNANTNYSLAVNYRLRASEKYDFRFDFFQKMSPSKQQELAQNMIDQLTAYLDANFLIKGHKLELVKSTKRMVSEMEEIVQEALQNYRNQNDAGFTAFSPAIRRQLDKIDGYKSPGKDAEGSSLINTSAAEQLQAIREAVTTDVKALMSSSWSQKTVSRYVDDYETERKKGSFSVNLGYGGIYLDGNLDNLTFGASPYVGLSLPLSNSAIAPKFLRNSSLILGAFWENFEDEAGNQISGLIVDRPIYAGLDYKLFEFIRFNAGAAFLEKTTTNGSDGSNKRSIIRPFVGLSARIDLSVSFGK
ncbi:MAG: hypothetical protein R2824_28710 [Saprospiraceae bacterium]|nr:hypothetical protein [Lewinella sp.]